MDLTDSIFVEKKWVIGKNWIWQIQSSSPSGSKLHRDPFAAGLAKTRVPPQSCEETGFNKCGQPVTGSGVHYR